MKEDKQVKTTSCVAGGNNYVLSRDMTPRLVPVADCKPLGRDTRKHPPQQVRKLAASLDRFGFVLPILVDTKRRVVAGWGLVLAARQLGLSEVPAVGLTDLSDAELRTLRLALNRLTDDAAWDSEALALEFSEILELEPQIDLELSGFEMGEIDGLQSGDGGLDQEDELPPIDPATTTPVTQIGDLWVLGGHHLFCGDALRAESYDRVLGTDRAQMMFADHPITCESRATPPGWERSNIPTLPWRQASSHRLSSNRFWGTRLAMRQPGQSPAPSTSCAWIGDTSGRSSPPAPTSTASSRTCAYETKAMPGWVRSIAQSMSWSSSSRSARALISTMSRSGAMAGTGRMSGTM